MSSVTVSELGRTIIRTKLKSTKNKLRVMETFCTDVSSQIQNDLTKLNTKRAELAQDLERLNNQKVTANNGNGTGPAGSSIPVPVGNSSTTEPATSPPAAAELLISTPAAVPASASGSSIALAGPSPVATGSPTTDQDNQAKVVRLLVEIRTIDQRLKLVNQKLKFINKTQKTLKRLKNERRDIRNQFNGIIHREFETNHLFY